MPKFVVALISAAFAVVIGFASGALLSKPSIDSTEAKIKKYEDIKQKDAQEKQELESKLNNVENENSRILREMKSLEQENWKLGQQVAQLENVNTLLKEKVTELEKLKEQLIEKALK
jgi:septal ring factor EnvC (AmiA/AmiB activator)